jgi:hypothetical protein
MAQGRNVSPKKKSISIGFERNTFAKVDALAAQSEINFSAMVRVLVNEALRARNLAKLNAKVFRKEAAE